MLYIECYSLVLLACTVFMKKVVYLNETWEKDTEP